MPFDHIGQLSAWLAEAGIVELELIGPSSRLRLSLDGDQDQVAEIEPSDEAEAEIITASTVGVFLHRHPMSGVALAPEGSPVRADRVVGLLRVGPLLVPVAAPKDGIVTAMLAPHEAVVGYGAELIAFHPSED